MYGKAYQVHVLKGDILQMTVFSKLVGKVHVVTIKIPAQFCCFSFCLWRNWQSNPNIHTEMQRNENGKTILKKNKVDGHNYTI